MSSKLNCRHIFTARQVDQSPSKSVDSASCIQTHTSSDNVLHLYSRESCKVLCTLCESVHHKRQESTIDVEPYSGIPYVTHTSLSSQFIS